MPERSQFSLLLRHFLERFFNHETASPDGDAKTRLVLIAFAAGLPEFVVAMYLWPVYHPFIGWPPGHALEDRPPYWLQVNHHFFFVLYSFVAIGIATVFEWDLFFPDLLDIFVLTTLPVPNLRLVFRARCGDRCSYRCVFVRCEYSGAARSSRRHRSTESAALSRRTHSGSRGSGLFAAIFILALRGRTAFHPRRAAASARFHF